MRVRVGWGAVGVGGGEGGGGKCLMSVMSERYPFISFFIQSGLLDQDRSFLMVFENGPRGMR